MKTLELLNRYQQMPTIDDNMDDWQVILWHASRLVKMAKKMRGTDKKVRVKTKTSIFKQEELF